MFATPAKANGTWYFITEAEVDCTNTFNKYSLLHNRVKFKLENTSDLIKFDIITDRDMNITLFDANHSFVAKARGKLRYDCENGNCNVDHYDLRFLYDDYNNIRTLTYEFRINCTYNTSTTTSFTSTSSKYDAGRSRKDSLSILFQYILIAAVGVFVIVGIFGYIDSRCIRINDFYKVGPLSTAAIQGLDMLSDCFLAIDISLTKDITPSKPFGIFLYLCIGFIIIPSLISLFQVYYYASKIWGDDTKTREWLLKYSKWLYIVSIFMGSSFTAVEIVNSSLFGLSYFEMNLSNRQMIAFKTQRIYSVVILEVK